MGIWQRKYVSASRLLPLNSVPGQQSDIYIHIYIYTHTYIDIAIVCALKVVPLLFLVMCVVFVLRGEHTDKTLPKYSKNFLICILH